MSTDPPMKQFPHTFITLLYDSSTNIIINNLNTLDIKTASSSSKTIRNLLHSSPQRNIVTDDIVYCIPCRNCTLKYIGETSRNLHACLKEHKRDIRVGKLDKALLNQIITSSYIQIKRLRRIFEVGILSFCKSLNNSPSFYNISTYLS